MGGHAGLLKVGERAGTREHQRGAFGFLCRLFRGQRRRVGARCVRRVLLCLDRFAFPATCHQPDLRVLSNFSGAVHELLRSMAMALGARLSRYRDFARFVAKYRHADFITGSGTTPANEIQSDASEARAFAADLETLGPTFIKLGQLLSTRADLLPPTTSMRSRGCRTTSSRFPSRTSSASSRKSWASGSRRPSSSSTGSPIAAASLGQVHRAVMRDGREVAVKVQRPNVRDRVLKDLDALDEVAALLRALQRGDAGGGCRPGVLEEFRRTIAARARLPRGSAEPASPLAASAARLRTHRRARCRSTTTRRRACSTMDYIEGTKITAVSPVEWTEVDGARACRRPLPRLPAADPRRRRVPRRSAPRQRLPHARITGSR